jgi:hypothetical protein
MRIAIISLQTEHTPPTSYGAVGRIAASHAAALSQAGHGVIVVAASGSVPPAIPNLHYLMRPLARSGVPIAEKLSRDIIEVLRGADVIHNHDPYLAGLASQVAVPIVETSHTVVAPVDRETPKCGVSTWHSDLLTSQGFSVLGVTRPNIRPRRRHFGPPLPRLLYVGQLRPEKGVHRLIDAARSFKLPLTLAGPVRRHDADWFEAVVRPVLSGTEITYVGEVDAPARDRLMAEHAALLFFSDPPEPLGLVMLEALACGTPVIALRRGAVPEIIANGRNGFIVDDVQDIPASFDSCLRLCRELISPPMQFDQSNVVSSLERIYERAVLHRS